jgi:tetratricopeptide (TPR) repeat protein
MFERLMLCPYAVVDLTQFNANVFYELGVRHAARPRSTVQIIAEGARLPFDVQMLRTIPYRVGSDGVPAVDALPDARAALTKFLEGARNEVPDSPIFQLLDGAKCAEVDHQKTDTFRERVEYSQKIKTRLAAARRNSIEEVHAIEESLQPFEDQEAGVLIDLLLSYRDVKGFQEMVGLFDRLPKHLQSTVLVREQYALALNRLGQRTQAEEVLKALINERGPSSETLSILGRVYKDAWEEARKGGRRIEASGSLKKAIEAYRKGFEADWRDAYPGVNAVTLMALQDPPDDRRRELIPIVRYAVDRKIATGAPDYWDYATLVELAVLAEDEAAAMNALEQALASKPLHWMAESTARNLRLIREARERNNTAVTWANEVEAELERI